MWWWCSSSMLLAPQQGAASHAVLCWGCELLLLLLADAVDHERNQGRFVCTAPVSSPHQNGSCCCLGLQCMCKSGTQRRSSQVEAGNTPRMELCGAAGQVSTLSADNSSTAWCCVRGGQLQWLCCSTRVTNGAPGTMMHTRPHPKSCQENNPADTLPSIALQPRFLMPQAPARLT